MPDNNNTNNNGSAVNNETDQLYTQRSTSSGRTEIQILEAMDKKFDALVKNLGGMSASNATNRYGRNGSTFFQNQNRHSSARGTYRDFEEQFTKSLTEGLFGSEFKRSMNDIRKQLAKDLGVELGELPKSLGELAGKEMSRRIQNSKLGKALLDPINEYKSKLANELKEAYRRGSDAKRTDRSRAFRTDSLMPDINDGRTDRMPDISEMFKNNKLSDGIVNALNEGGLESFAGELTDMMATTGNAEVALGGLTEMVKMVNPKILVAALAIDTVSDIIDKKLKRNLEEFNKLVKTTMASMSRYETSRKNALDLAQKRLEADVRTMVETPFKILEDAAQRWYDAWDNNLRTIAATQGYNKDQVSYLYGAFVDRLKEDGLASVIGANDIVNNLSNVLGKGLQGAAAEEFAYLATKLNAAIPTQDFFNYIDTYASVAMNAINQGKSQEEALQLANRELEEFANSLLVASHEIAGGFTTGLQNASDLFQRAEQIAQAGRGANGIALGSTFAAISGIVGAVAPDLASGIIDAVYKAAVGGNASEIVALRSLAGINASNTEFLRALTENPQEVFGNLFDKLALYQNMSNGAYMEVAEGLSSTFGVSMDSLARVDFTQVANAVRASSDTNYELDTSMKLLASGQTTTNAEILRMREVTEFMADEGLSYVLDSEAGRAVQQHMWEEQMMRELQETTYAVELKGDARKFLEGIASTVTAVTNLLNPAAWFSGIASLVTTAKQDDYLRQDIAEMLTLGQIGGGNARVYANLTSYNKKLSLIPDLVSLLGGSSTYQYTNSVLGALRDNYVDPRNANGENIYTDSSSAYYDLYYGSYERHRKSPIKRSTYNWNIIGKSALSYADYDMPNYTGDTSMVAVSALNTASQTQSKLNENMQAMLDSMEAFYNEDTTRTYEEYIKTAYKYGIADYETALENSGLTNEAVKGRYEALQAQTGAKMKAEREQKEEKFWEDNVAKLTASNTLLDSINATTSKIYTIFDKFLAEWEDYFINHTVYNSTFTADAVEKVLSEERDSSETAIYALADALTQNDMKLLLDPTAQTNALLAQILKVANAILTQNATGAGNISLPDTLAGLSLGIINQ